MDLQTLENITQNFEIKYSKICIGIFRNESSKKKETNILAVLRFEMSLERDAFRFNQLSTFFRVGLKYESWRSWRFVF